MGVKIRGTDYVNNKPYGHPIQPEIEDVLRKSKTILKKYNCNKLFSGTEDYVIYKLFHETFGDNLISSENSATSIIRLWSRRYGGYEYEHIYHLGCYGIDDI